MFFHETDTKSETLAHRIIHCNKFVDTDIKIILHDIPILNNDNINREATD